VGKTDTIKEPVEHYSGVGVALGVAFGVALGAALDNSGTGIALGVAMGLQSVRVLVRT